VILILLTGKPILITLRRAKKKLEVATNLPLVKQKVV
jgi:hypothetical protein